MKRLLLAAGLLLSRLAPAQETPYQFSPLPLDAHSHRVVYAGTQTAPDASADALLVRAAAWPATGPYQASNRRTNAAAGTTSTHVLLRRGQEHYAGRLTVQVHEGGYSYRLTDLTHTRPDYARAGKHSPGLVTTQLETLVYTRPSRQRTKRLAEISTLLQQLLTHFHQAMLPEGQPTVSTGQ